MSASDQETYIKRLGALGYAWQFITLAGLHSTALISDQFSREYAKRGMRAYGELIQEPEMESGCDALWHALYVPERRSVQVSFYLRDEPDPQQQGQARIVRSEYVEFVLRDGK